LETVADRSAPVAVAPAIPKVGRPPFVVLLAAPSCLRNLPRFLIERHYQS